MEVLIPQLTCRESLKIEAAIGDELIIKHSDFETVYYIIKSKERIKVEVRPNHALKAADKLFKSNPKLFNTLIDSAEMYLKSDAEKSIQFIADALAISNSTKQNAEVYETLGNVYFEWKQYDLAVTNYRISLQNVASNDVKLRLAKAFEFNKNYQECKEIYNSLIKEDLSNWQLTALYEGLGDVYVKTKDFTTAINTYKQGLQVAQDHLIIPKITDLNSKIAQAYDASGAKQEAQNYFENSLTLAVKENKKRAVEEKVKVADFQSKNRAFNEEIELRKQVLEDIETDSIFKNEKCYYTTKAKL